MLITLELIIFLTVVDDFSRCTWVFVMKYKSETQNVLKSLFSLVSTQYDTRIRKLQIDGALVISFNELHFIFLIKGV